MRVVFTEGAVLGGTGAGERERKEREQHVLPSPERGQGDVGPRGGRQREIGRHGPDGQGRRGRSRQRQAPAAQHGQGDPVDDQCRHHSGPITPRTVSIGFFVAPSFPPTR